MLSSNSPTLSLVIDPAPIALLLHLLYHSSRNEELCINNTHFDLTMFPMDNNYNNVKMKVSLHNNLLQIQ